MPTKCTTSAAKVSSPTHRRSSSIGWALSTPIRQYDDDGTQAIFDFFGPVVFRFTLEEAIGRCLVQYDYFVHPVELTASEMDAWLEIAAKIKVNAWRSQGGKPDEYMTKLLRDRRALLENAENKIAALEIALERENLSVLRHTLIYASDKAPEQLEAVNALLKAHGILFHQLTYEETANRPETARIIRSFQDGTLRVLTAKRVLDEGVNIPQIRKPTFWPAQRSSGSGCSAADACCGPARKLERRTARFTTSLRCRQFGKRG